MLVIETVTVVGNGDPARSLALLSALAGCAVRALAADRAQLPAAQDRFRHGVDLALAAGALTRTERQRVLDGVLFTADLEEAATGADLAADAVDLEGAAFAALAEHVRATTVLATVGGPPAAEIVAALAQTGRAVGVVLAPTGGPLPRLELVAPRTAAAHAIERAAEFAARVNRAARNGR